jgi:arylsulfatase
MTDKLLSYLDETPLDQPYFAFLGYTAPHWPLQAPQAAIKPYESEYQEGWDELRARRMQGAIAAGVVPEHATAVDFEAGMTPWMDLSEPERLLETKKMQVYAGMVSLLDQNVGRLLDALAQRGDLDNTIIVFIADNGAEAHPMERYPSNIEWVEANFDNSLQSIGSRHSYVSLGPSWARATAAPFRASKSKISEGGIRVPAFINMPGSSRTGIDDSYMRVMDLAPTFIDLAGGKVPEDMMGRSLLPRIREGEAVYSTDEFIAAETYGRRMAQQGGWKVLLQAPPYGTGDWQLYNLAEDLGEQNDLSDEFPERRASLIDAWQQYADRVGVINPEVPIRY